MHDRIILVSDPLKYLITAYFNSDFCCNVFFFCAHDIYTFKKRSLFSPRRSFLMPRRQVCPVISFQFLEQQKKYPFKQNPSSSDLSGLKTILEMLACWNWSSSPPHHATFPHQQVAKCSVANSWLGGKGGGGGQFDRSHQRGKINWARYKGGGERKQITEIGACLLAAAAGVHSIKYFDFSPLLKVLFKAESVTCMWVSRRWLLG